MRLLGAALLALLAVAPASVRTLARVEMPDMSCRRDNPRALFTVWFGPEPGDANLKRGMLGK